jgi:tetratricopeptide (TPR) repeat protein
MLAHLRSDFSTATFHAQACIELGQSLANSFFILGGYFVLGMSQASSGDYQLALDNLLYALELSETVEDRFWRARLLNTIGWVYRELFDLERAIHFDQASLELARSGEPRLTEAEGNALANLAMDYLLREEYDQVKAYLEEGLTPSANESFMRWRYHTRMVVIKGRLALLEGDVAGALAAADESLAMAQETRARKNIARSCRLRGEALLAQGQLEPARRALSHALSIGVSLQSPGLIWPYQVALANFEEASGNLELARTYYLEAAEVLYDLTNRLTNPVLCRQFTAAPPVQAVFSKAVCPVKLNQPLRLAVSL